ncbi:MAG: hypothetical protein GWM98_04560 [Nitrospinaceae bacterium]|nr:hypothetical protein [Deltaproteobacteria bacterium]NIY14191.1 hypothetical protein [Nitrospinaceae bacterium]
MNKPIIAIDVETRLARSGDMAPRIVCMSATNPFDLQGDWIARAILTGEEIRRGLGVILPRAAAGELVIVGHFVAFDFACILANYPELWDLVWEAYHEDGIVCTAIREKLLDIAEGEFMYYTDREGKKRETNYSLEESAARWLGLEMDKGPDSWQTRFAELEGIPVPDWPEEAIEYAEADAVAAHGLYMKQEERAERISHDIPTQYEDSRADFALRLMSVWGIEVDRDRVEKLWRVTVERMEGYADRVVAAGLASRRRPSAVLWEEEEELPALPDVKKDLTAVRTRILEHYPGGDPPRTQKTRKIQTGQEVIEACRDQALIDLARFEGLRKTASTYLTKLLRPIVHASYKGIGAASNRTSCSGPNIQNQPRLPGVRECFRARPGCVFVSCDFDSQEMRTLAQSCVSICGRSRLAQRYQQDRHFDPHLELAANLAKIPIEDAAEMLKAGDKEVKRLRQHAKIANFGFPGGMGTDGFVAYARGWGVDMSDQRAKHLRAAWFLQWPEMRTMFDHVRGLARANGWAVQTNPLSGFRRAGCGFTDAANGYFQTLAAHASKAALWEVSRRCYADRGSYLYGSRPVAFVHDEIIIEAPEWAAHKVAEEVETVLIECMERWTPDVPAAASASLMRRWSKRAERVKDRNGRLIPWEDRHGSEV